MNPNLIKFTATAALALATAVIATNAQSAKSSDTAAKPSTPPSAGLLNDLLRKDFTMMDAWDIGGQIRLRGEHREDFAAPGVPGAADFRAAGGNHDNTFLMLREKIHAGYKPADWISGYVEGRDSRAWGDDRT